jgi:hypothetical protein
MAGVSARVYPQRMSFKDWMVVALAILVVWAVFAWLTR